MSLKNSNFQGIVTRLPISTQFPYWIAVDKTKPSQHKPNCLLPDEKTMYEQLCPLLPWPLVGIIISYLQGDQIVYFTDKFGLRSFEIGAQTNKLLCKTPYNFEFESAFVDPNDRSVLLTTSKNIYRYNHKTLSLVLNGGAASLIGYPRIADVSSCGKVITLLSRPNYSLQILNLNSQPKQSELAFSEVTRFRDIKMLKDPFMAIQDPFDPAYLLITCSSGVQRLHRSGAKKECQTLITLEMCSCSKFMGIVTTPSKWCIFTCYSSSKQNNYVFAYNSQTTQLIPLVIPAIISTDKTIENIAYASSFKIGGSPLLFMSSYNQEHCLYSLTLDPFFDVLSQV